MSKISGAWLWYKVCGKVVKVFVSCFSRCLLEYETSFTQNLFHKVLRNNMLICEPLRTSQNVRKLHCLLYAGDRQCVVLTRSSYVKFDNYFELCESMEGIKAHFWNWAKTLDHIKPTQWEERVFVKPSWAKWIRVFNCKLSTFISTMLNEFAQIFQNPVHHWITIGPWYF